MSPERKDRPAEAAVLLVLAALAALAVVFAWSVGRIAAWSEAEIAALAPEAAAAVPDPLRPAPPALAAVSAVDAPSDAAVSAPDGPIHAVYADGGPDAWFGDASWYDYTFRGDAAYGTPCFRDRERCWTEDRPVAASRDYPRGTRLTVTNLTTGAEVVVTVTDYGPDAAVHPTRIVDLSSFAFSRIADLSEGIVYVSVEEAPEGRLPEGERR